MNRPRTPSRANTLFHTCTIVLPLSSTTTLDALPNCFKDESTIHPRPPSCTKMNFSVCSLRRTTSKGYVTARGHKGKRNWGKSSHGLLATAAANAATRLDPGASPPLAHQATIVKHLLARRSQPHHRTAGVATALVHAQCTRRPPAHWQSHKPTHRQHQPGENTSSGTHDAGKRAPTRAPPLHLLQTLEGKKRQTSVGQNA